MKFNTILFSTALAVTSMFTVSAHADNSTRIAATSALGSVVGTAVGKQIGGNTGAMIGSAVGGAGGAAASTNRR
ncbi:hypothetical protein J0904_19720, partial [Acinetobacter bereziniae]|nr:hypothetical protein [Acinetobacter bereziniae]